MSDLERALSDNPKSGLMRSSISSKQSPNFQQTDSWSLDLLVGEGPVTRSVQNGQNTNVASLATTATLPSYYRNPVCLRKARSGTGLFPSAAACASPSGSRFG